MKQMGLLVAGCSQKPLVSKLSNIAMDYTAIEHNALRKLCNTPIKSKDFTLKIPDISVIGNLSRGLSLHETEEVEKCIYELYEKHQADIVSRAFEKLIFKDSPVFSILKNETEESMNKLIDKFYITKVSFPTKRKVASWYQIDLEFKCDDITFTGTKYTLCARILVKFDKKLDYKVIKEELKIV